MYILWTCLIVKIVFAKDTENRNIWKSTKTIFELDQRFKSPTLTSWLMAEY